MFNLRHPIDRSKKVFNASERMLQRTIALRKDLPDDIKAEAKGLLAHQELIRVPSGTYEYQMGAIEWRTLLDL